MVERLELWIELSNNQRNLSRTGNQSQDTENGTSQGSHDQLHNHDSVNENDVSSGSDVAAVPDFPLLPASKGFCLTLKKHLDNYKNVLKEHIWRKDLPNQ